MKLGRKTRSDRWLGLYTAMFLVGISGMALVMAMYGRTLIWIGYAQDSLKQSYTILGYIGKVLRDLLAGKGFQMVNLSLGQGFDVLTTASYYGFADPLNWLSVFVQERGTEVLYVVVGFLRTYLAGVCCGLYLPKMYVKDGWAVACGCTIYVFAGYAIWMLGRHSYFLNGALYLPLLLLGIERVFEGRKWLMFTLITALMLVVNFYFAFMNTVVAVLYILVRLAVCIRSRGVKESAKDGFVLLGSYLLGAALSSVIFIPVVRLFLQSGRTSVDTGYSGSMLHYGLSYYLSIFTSLFAPWKFGGNYLLISYAPVALFGLLAMLYLRGHRVLWTRIALCVCMLGVCLPAVGSLMNGGAYASNRWIYIMGLFVALGSAMGLQSLFELEKKKIDVIVRIALVYSVLCAGLALISDNEPALAGPVLVALFAVMLLVYNRGRISWLNAGRMRSITALYLAVACAAHGMVVYLPLGYGYIKDQAKWGVYDGITNETAANLIEDDGVYRVAQAGYDDAQAVLLDYMGTSFYWSLVEGEITEHYAQTGVPAQRFSYDVETLGGGSIINGVAAVKYFVRNEGQNYVIPYGYEYLQNVTLPDGKTAEIYENSYVLPLGYAFDAVLPEEAYDQLAVEDKLRALMQFAVCDVEVDMPRAELEDSVVSIPYEIVSKDNVEWNPEGLITAGKDGKAKLAFQAPADSETYLIFEGFETHGGTTESAVRVTSDAGESIGYVTNRRSNFFYNKPAMAFCLGTGALSECEIEFKNARDYSYDELRIVSIPLSEYRRNTQKLQTECMEDVELSNNCIEGKITVEGDRVLQIAVPYSEGWTAEVDGEKAEIFLCGGMYMGIALGAGTHEIEMRYVTPGLKAGAMISATALLLIAALLIAGNAKKRRGGRI